MIELQKHLTIREAKNELRKAENELDLYLTKKEINYLKTQPSAVKYKDIVASSHNIFDKFTHYVIKDEEVDLKIYGLQETINSYQKYIISEMKRISDNGGSELITFLRDEMKMKWEEIAKYTNYSERQVRRLYNKTNWH
jgi:hypothetical protein